MSCFLAHLLGSRAIVPRWLDGGLRRVTQLTFVPRCLLLLAPVVVGQVLAVQLAQAEAATDLLPNLVALPPGRGYVDSEGGRLLLRFNGRIYNAGPGRLEVRGVRASTSDSMVAHQRIYRSDGSYRDVVMNAHLIYSTADGHNHWHLQNIVKYSLWDEARTREVAPAMKVGFCLEDDHRFNLEVGPPSPVYNGYCQEGNPNALSGILEGISAGWYDIYPRSVASQWVDVTDVKPGAYWLREDVDPDRFVTEDPASRAPEYVTAYGTAPIIIPQRRSASH